MLDLQFEFLLNELEVGQGFAVALGDNLVAVAKIAEFFTKRQVHVDGQGFETGQDALSAVLEGLGIVARTKGLFELLKAWVSLKGGCLRIIVLEQGLRE